MQKQTVMFTLALVLVVHALHLKQTHQQVAGLVPGTVSLRADNNQLLKLGLSIWRAGVRDVSNYPAIVSATNDDEVEWQMEVRGEKVAFKGSMGKYLAVCEDCWTTSSARFTAFVTADNPWIGQTANTATFTARLLANGKYTFTTNSGRSLGRGQNVVTTTISSNIAYFENIGGNQNAAFEWSIIRAPLKSGYVSLIADNNQFLYESQKNRTGVHILNAPVVILPNDDEYSNWYMEVRGGRVAFKGNSGKYMSICDSCYQDRRWWINGFTTVQNAWQGWAAGAANFKYQFLQDGTYSFTTSSGLVLARLPVVDSFRAPSRNVAWFWKQASPVRGHFRWKIRKNQRLTNGQKYSIIADNNEFLRPITSTTASTANGQSPAGIQNNSDWKGDFQVEVRGTKIALKGSDGKYMSECNSCWVSANNPSAAFFHVSNPYPDGLPNHALFTPQPLPNGRYALRLPRGVYLTRCSGCASIGSLSSFAFFTNDRNSPQAQWQFRQVQTLSSGRVQIQASNGNFLSICPSESSCGFNGPRWNVPTQPTVLPQKKSERTRWMIELRQGKVALRNADNDRYLRRCSAFNCHRYKTNSRFAAAVDGRDWRENLLTAERQSNGKYAFRNSSGYYLTMCTGTCTTNPTSSQDKWALFRSTDPNDPNAQWTVTPLPPVANIDAPVTSVAQFCWKGSYRRSPNSIFRSSCNSDQQMIWPFCYTLCRAGYYGVWEICWQNAPNGWVGCGFGAAPSTSDCVQDMIAKIQSIGEVVAFFATFGSSSLATSAAKAASASQVKADFTRVQTMYKSTQAARDAIAKAKELDDAKSLVEDSLELATADPEAITTEDMIRIAASYAALVDKTGISGVVSSFSFPTCDKIRT